MKKKIYDCHQVDAEEEDRSLAESIVFNLKLMLYRLYSSSLLLPTKLLASKHHQFILLQN